MNWKIINNSPKHIQLVYGKENHKNERKMAAEIKFTFRGWEFAFKLIQVVRRIQLLAVV